jgi:hypothetical protein
MEIIGASGRRYYFVSSQIHPTHVWEQGELGPEDSNALADILSTKDAYYRPVVVLLKDLPQETETLGSPVPAVEAFMTAESVVSRDPLDFQDRDSNRIDDRLEKPKRRRK